MNFLLALIPAIALIAVFFGEKKPYVTHEQGIVVITGASTGIGRHAAEHLARNYKFTVLAGVRKESDAESITKMNIPNLKPLMVDVAKEDSCRAAMNQVEKLVTESGLPLVALVNNAGISTKMPVEYVSLDDAKKLFDTNFFGTLSMTQLALPLLRSSKGRVVMTSSVAGIIARAYSSMYTASKFAMEGFADSLRREVDRFGVSVSVVEPAFVKTPIFNTSTVHLVNSVSTLTDEQKAVYPEFFSPSYGEKYTQLFAKASPADVTTNAIVDAIVSPVPKTRYVVANANGLPAVLVCWLDWLLTDRLVDRMLTYVV